LLVACCTLLVGARLLLIIELLLLFQQVYGLCLQMLGGHRIYLVGARLLVSQFPVRSLKERLDLRNQDVLPVRTYMVEITEER
jgi:hypothetical protein